MDFPKNIRGANDFSLVSIATHLIIKVNRFGSKLFFVQKSVDKQFVLHADDSPFKTGTWMYTEFN